MVPDIRKKIGKIFALAALLLCFPLVVFAADAETTLTPRRISLGESAVLKISIEGAGVKCENVPKVDGVDIRYSGVQHSFKFINGEFSRSVVFSYTLSPSREGTFTIPTFKFSDGSSSRAVVLTVTKGQGGGSGAFGGRAAGSVVFVGKCEFSAEEVFVGEPVFLRYYVYSRGTGDITLEGLEKMPEAKGFVEKEIEESQGSETIESEGGDIAKDYLFTFVLVPTEAGTKQAGSCSGIFSLAGTGMFSFPQRKRLIFEPASIKVKPLPAAGQPKEFAGNVGSFTMETTGAPVENAKVNVFDEIKLKLSIKGEGNFVSIGKPVLTGSAEGLHVFISDGVVDFSPDGDTLKGSVDFDVTLIPEKAGGIDAGKFVFSFYDTKQAEYKTIETKPILLNVTGEADAVESFTFNESDDTNIQFNYAFIAAIAAVFLALGLFAFTRERGRKKQAEAIAAAEKKPEPQKPKHIGAQVFELHKEALLAADGQREAAFASVIEKLADIYESTRINPELAAELSVYEGKLKAAAQIKEELYAVRFGGGQITADKWAVWIIMLKEREV